MTSKEFSAAFKIAQSKRHLGDEAAGLFDGFGLPDFKVVHVTLDQVAELIRWQALQMNREFDPVALQEIADAGRKKFMIIGSSVGPERNCDE